MEKTINSVAWIDTELTGKDPNNDRIVQIAVFKTDMQMNITDQMIVQLVNPSIPIPPKSTEVHRITDEMVLNAPTFAEIAGGLFNFINECHIAAYNGVFDVKALTSEFNRANISFYMNKAKIIDPLSVLRVKEPRDQSSVYKYYTGKTLEDAHSADADIMATFDIAKAQIEKYEDISSLEDLMELSGNNERCDLDRKIIINEDGVPVFNFGAHYGKPISEEEGFLKWMLDKDFSRNTKEWIERYLKTTRNE